MVFADWLDFSAITALAGMMGIEGDTTALSMNTSDNGTLSTGRGGNSWWAGLDTWWAWLKCPDSVQVSLCQASGN